MDIEQIIDSMTPEVYQRLATAVELGKWPDGVALTPEQKENSLQLVMLWQARYNTDAQHMTIDTRGQMVMKSKQQLKEDFGMSLTPDNCNFNGSGIALGHPVGSTGLRIVVSLYYELERQGKTLGGASLCVGTGPAMASLWTREHS